MDITGRVDTLSMQTVELCEHINIEIRLCDEECEFAASLDIKCQICDETHEVTILIN